MCNYEDIEFIGLVVNNGINMTSYMPWIFRFILFTKYKPEIKKVLGKTVYGKSKLGVW